MNSAVNALPLQNRHNTTHKVSPISLDLVLPWYPSEKEEQRFKKILIGFLVVMCLLMLILTFSPVVDRVADEEEIVVKTKVLLEPVKLEPIEVEPPKPEPKPEPIAPPKPTEQKALATSSKVKDTPSTEPTSNGLSKVSDQLSALRNSFDLSRNQKKNVVTSDAGTKEKTSRTLLGKDNATKKSDGIKVDSDIMLDERTTLAAHNAAAVEGIDHGGVDGGSPVSRYASHMSGERTMESIRYTLEKNKGGIFTLYYQALNQNPGISGKYTFELVIKPDGSITSLKLISSELGDTQLDEAILQRIRKIKFKAEDVIVARVTYTYNFIES